MRYFVLFLTLLFASSLAAQQVTVGTALSNPSSFETNASAPRTYINLTDSAAVAGTVNKASVVWSGTCANAFKIVFLRSHFSSSFNVVATRGPFNAVSGRNDVTLSPPVTLAVGDVIGIVQLQDGSVCGTAYLQKTGNTGLTLETTNDVSADGTVGPGVSYDSSEVIGAFAYNSDPVLVRILPAAGAVQGSGAFFRTSLQLINVTSSPVTGSLVFHKAGQSASAGDPSLPFTLNSDHALSYPDVVTSLGSSGLGSLDVLTNGGALPLVSARVFSDAGSAGTSGFSEEGLNRREALKPGVLGALSIPSDLTNFRMNVGVRTLESGATVVITMYSASGLSHNSRTVTYAANYFEQVALSQFLGTSNIEEGGWIFIGISSGSAFVYSSVIDNHTSDSTYHLADVK